MRPEKRISLIKELDNLKRINSRNSYFGAWSGLIMFGTIFAGLLIDPWKIVSNPELSWVAIILYFVVLVIIFQSFFVLTRHLTNKRLILILEALLDDESRPSQTT